jgi:hypothetical protein
VVDFVFLVWILPAGGGGGLDLPVDPCSCCDASHTVLNRSLLSWFLGPCRPGFQADVPGVLSDLTMESAGPLKSSIYDARF